MQLNKIKTENQKLIFKVSGRLDSATSAELQQQLLSGFDECKQVELDCTELAYVSSAGVRAMLCAEQRAAENGGAFTLKNVCAEIMDVFDMTGFSDILNIENRENL